jgi:hypothetical protein
VNCNLWTASDRPGRCCWCPAPFDEHRFLPCPTCNGHPFLATPTPKNPMGFKPCACGNGYLVRATGRPATREELRTVGWQPVGGWPDLR